MRWRFKLANLLSLSINITRIDGQNDGLRFPGKGEGASTSEITLGMIWRSITT